MILIFISFFDEIALINHNSPRWGYHVCLCPIKGTSGLNELRNSLQCNNVHAYSTYQLVDAVIQRMKVRHIVHSDRSENIDTVYQMWLL